MPVGVPIPFCCLFKCCLHNNGITSAKCHTKYQRTICPVRHIKAESVVPVRVRHVVPEIRVGESGIRPVPEIAAPVCDKSYFKIISVYYLEGQPPLLLAQNSPLKGSELNAESVVPVRARHAVPETRAGEPGTRPAPENAAP